MQLSYDEAKLIAGFLLADYERERLTTIKVLESIPDGKGDYTPDPKSMSALKLAFHLVASEWYLLEAIHQGAPPTMNPEVLSSTYSAQEVVAWAESKVPAQIEKVKSLSGELLSRTIAFETNRKLPAYSVLLLLLKHTIHHRGQLSAYLRPMGAVVPSMYGPSADSQ